MRNICHDILYRLNIFSLGRFKSLLALFRFSEEEFHRVGPRQLAHVKVLEIIVRQPVYIDRQEQYAVQHILSRWSSATMILENSCIRSDCEIRVVVIPAFSGFLLSDNGRGATLVSELAKNLEHPRITVVARGRRYFDWEREARCEGDVQAG